MQSLWQGGLATLLVPGAVAGAWRAVAATPADAPTRTLTSPQARLIALLADAILPRSDTPSATDVGVIGWIDAVATDYFSSVQRSDFLDCIGAIDEHAVSIGGGRLESLPAGVVAGVVTSLDSACGRKNLSPAERGYALLKELVVFGYFTSEPVQKNVLQVPIVPGRFDPSVPIPTPVAK